MIQASKILKLSDHLIAKIAAGEVIERPAAVVKELVENSIDAGARQIEIEVAEGGRQLIRVSDDGCGMIETDLLLSVERHATSKIREAEDLFRIATLGFRGEALPSIAAVSWMKIESRSAEGPGVQIELEGGKLLHQGPVARTGGTTITVRNLFFNTPARLKFLKSTETEFSHIAAFVESIALSRPQLGFRLLRSLTLPPRKMLRERIADLWGNELVAGLVPVSASRDRFELVGFVGNHQTNSSSPKSLYFFVNGRMVRDKTIQHAVQTAYENLLMKHRYPWAFLYLTVPADLVDVNVHPTKTEVRFAQAQVVHELVREGVRGALAGDNPAVLGSVVSVGSQNVAPPAGGSSPSSCGTRLRSDRSSELSENPPAGGTFRVIGQVHGTYLLCETPEKLILIDQHAAHERIGFEKLKKQFESGGVARQALLLPQTFELKPSEAEILGMYLADLEKFGLEVESFGKHSFMLRAVPALLAGEDCVALLVDLIDELQSFGKLGPLEEKVHEVLETIACHYQVRAGDRLGTLEIESLLREMESTDFSYSCPHGRPVKVEIPFTEIEKWFKRRL